MANSKEKTRLSVSFSKDLRDIIDKKADSIGCSSSAVVAMIVMEYLKQEHAIDTVGELLKGMQEFKGALDAEKISEK